MKRELHHFVSGKSMPGQSGRFAEVFDPNSGAVQAHVPLASKAEVEAVIADSAKAQAEWARWNPQRRARVLMRFLELIRAEHDDLAKLLSSEHGKTIADAQGDIQRGLEVVEFAIGIPHLLKGSSPTVPARGSTCIRCDSRWVWLRASPRSTSPP